MTKFKIIFSDFLTKDNLNGLDV